MDKFITEEKIRILKGMEYAGLRSRYWNRWPIKQCPFCCAPAELWVLFDPDDKAEDRDGYGSRTEEKAAVVRCSSCGAMSPVLTRQDTVNRQPIRGPLGPEVIRHWNQRFFL